MSSYDIEVKTSDIGCVVCLVGIRNIFQATYIWVVIEMIRYHVQ